MAVVVALVAGLNSTLSPTTVSRLFSALREDSRDSMQISFDAEFQNSMQIIRVLSHAGEPALGCLAPEFHA